jgi:hypothetical protein
VLEEYAVKLRILRMAKVYRPYFPEQDFLLPPSLREWLREDHLSYFVSDLIDQLDLGAIESPYECEERGYEDAQADALRHMRDRIYISQTICLWRNLPTFGVLRRAYTDSPDNFTETTTKLGTIIGKT